MTEIKYYSGVGSRTTPDDICELMVKIARYLYFKGYTLRSGGAKKADESFEKGAGNKKEIFLPWPAYNNSEIDMINIPDEAFEIASKTHLAWHLCKEGARKCHARNALIVYGKDLQMSSDFVVCWTRKGKLVGGTSMAIRLAMAKDIPVFNLGKEEDKERILKAINSKEVTWSS